MNTINKGGVVITFQTGLDEAFIIGTKKELLEFAQNIINSINNSKDDDFFGEKVKACSTNNYSFAQYSQVSLDWLVVTKDNEQTYNIFHNCYEI